MSAQTQALETRTFLPEHLDELAPVLSFLEAHGQKRGTTATPSYALVGTGEHERIELPQAVHQVLTQVVTALLAGKAVTVAPQSMTLTTQQAADLLGVSRPTVVRLITEGHLPAERVGNRHRLLLDNVLVYREARRQRQYDALAETAVDIDTEDDPATIREQLREAREAVARRRRAAKA
ncbi:helix-turn-helix domain-containing protein [Antrihabitans sp. NCIMB 15449]|uniref:Helix-turn-helix domain-containing protein n=1 Tax=Antrihabitans spumae TaxID=3373370 RepID=A0ABW7JW71_9NOCA